MSKFRNYLRQPFRAIAVLLIAITAAPAISMETEDKTDADGMPPPPPPGAPTANYPKPTPDESLLYQPIQPACEDATITLDGRNLTVAKAVEVARCGAKVRVTQSARTRVNDSYELLLEGACQGIPIYFFNRFPGSGREEAIFEGCAGSPENEQLVKDRQLQRFQNGARRGIGPEVDEEEIVRAMLVTRLNQLLAGYTATSPQLLEQLIQLINRRVTPVVYSQGSPGEGDLNMMANVAATMVGTGEAYYNGSRMTASDALSMAGMQPLEPFAADLAAAISTNAYSAGRIILMLYDAERMLSWQDLTFAMSMEGLNSSVTPLVSVTQKARPFPYQMVVADNLLEMVRGSYLFELDDERIIQDPLSFRDTSQRNGAAWKAYARLKHDMLIQINSSDHNPASAAGASPESWALKTPWLQQYQVESEDGGPTGFILSNSNFESITWGNDVEAFNIAVAQMLAITAQRPLRLEDTFFTVISPSDVLSAEELAGAPSGASSYVLSDLIAEIQQLANPIPAQGNALVSEVEDVEAFTRQKASRAEQVVDEGYRLVGQELLSASYWMNVRQAQDAGRTFGEVTSAAWKGFREVVPWQSDDRPQEPLGNIVYRFLKTHPASRYTGQQVKTISPIIAEIFACHLEGTSPSASGESAEDPLGCHQG